VHVGPRSKSAHRQRRFFLRLFSSGRDCRAKRSHATGISPARPALAARTIDTRVRQLFRRRAVDDFLRRRRQYKLLARIRQRIVRTSEAMWPSSVYRLKEFLRAGTE